eukprot:s255_g32.t1
MQHAEHTAQRKKRRLSICLEAGFRPPFSQALIAYSHALEWDENSAPMCDEFGQFLLAHNQLAGAEYLFSRALSLDPLNAQYCYRQGVVLQQQKQLKQAAQSFTAALQQNPRFLGALFNLGIVHRELGETTRAAEQFKRLLQINAEEPPAPPWNLSFMKGRLWKTCYDLSNSLRFPCFSYTFSDPCALALLGECQADLGDFEGAVRSLEDAVRLDPQNRFAALATASWSRLR